MTTIPSLHNTPLWLLVVKKLFHSARVPQWCLWPYPNHPRGCPMYGTRPQCPPQAPYITEVLDTRKPMYIVHSEFNVATHAEMMKKRHPTWTQRQLRNCLYWQGKSRKQLKQRIAIAIKILKTNAHTTMPEASGINVYSTCRAAGLKLERINLNMRLNRHVAILGWK